MKKILMVILDGFGMREEEHGNAVKKADMPFFNKLWNEYPHALLEASGEYVGLPETQFGNSEVCHGVIGLGRKTKQKLTIIEEELNKKSMKENENLKDLVSHTIKNNSNLHLMGLLSDGGVHSHLNYMLKIIPLLKEMGVNKIYFHVITDGRDTTVNSSLNYIKKLEEVFKENNIGEIVTVCGRYYAMDRDRKYERTAYYYNMIAKGAGLRVLDLETAILNCYKRDIYDEFLPPIMVKHNFKLNDNDALLWLNFRHDRAIQIINAFSDNNYEGFPRIPFNNLKVYTLFEQEDIKNVTPIFKEEKEELYPVGEYFSDLGITQARVAETEKYSHVTKFFNAEKSKKFKGTENFLIPSPKVSTYDLTPLMSSSGITDQTIKCMEDDYEFILVNYACPDMVGHTGNMEATVESLTLLDRELERLINGADENFYKTFILSDHGNSDTMMDSNNTPVTTHSMEKVPFIILDKGVSLLSKGSLTNVAPTLLDYVDIAIPEDMKESKSLIIKDI